MLFDYCKSQTVIFRQKLLNFDMNHDWFFWSNDDEEEDKRLAESIDFFFQWNNEKIEHRKKRNRV